MDPVQPSSTTCSGRSVVKLANHSKSIRRPKKACCTGLTGLMMHLVVKVTVMVGFWSCFEVEVGKAHLEIEVNSPNSVTTHACHG